MTVPAELLPPGGFDEVSEGSPLYEKLVKCGFLVDDAKDEVQELMQESRNSDFHEERLSMKLSKEVCRQCRIAPLCMGGCCQRNYETKNRPGCINGYTEDDSKYGSEVSCSNQ